LSGNDACRDLVASEELMGAPIAVELVASLPASDEAAQALIASCSGAAGPAGCIFTDTARATDERAHVVVEFADGYARVRVQVTLAPSAATHGGPRSAMREARFREEDPIVERFRAAGLIVAGLVSELTPERVRPPPPPPVPSPPSDIVEPAPTPAVFPVSPKLPVAQDWTAALSLAGFVGISSVRPRFGLALAADSAFHPSAVFLTTSASYEQAIERDSMGISDVRGRLGAGLGAYVPIAGPALSLVGRARVEVEDLRVSVSQPQTGRYDAASRVLPGFAGEGEVAWSVLPGVAVFADVRAAWVDEQIDVAVAGRPAAVISSWMFGAGLGLAVEIR
jgi:hypothetical protein